MKFEEVTIALIGVGLAVILILFVDYLDSSFVREKNRVTEMEQVINKLSRDRSDLLLQRNYCYNYLKEHKDMYEKKQ